MGDLWICTRCFSTNTGDFATCINVDCQIARDRVSGKRRCTRPTPPTDAQAVQAQGSQAQNAQAQGSSSAGASGDHDMRRGLWEIDAPVGLSQATDRASPNAPGPSSCGEALLKGDGGEEFVVVIDMIAHETTFRVDEAAATDFLNLMRKTPNQQYDFEHDDSSSTERKTVFFHPRAHPRTNPTSNPMTTSGWFVHQPLKLPEQVDRISKFYIKTLYWRCMAVQNRIDFMLTGTCEVPSYVRLFPGGLNDLVKLANALDAVTQFGDLTETLEPIAIPRKSSSDAAQRKYVDDEKVVQRGREIGYGINMLYDCLLTVQRCIEVAAGANVGSMDPISRTGALSHKWSHFRVRLRDYLNDEQIPYFAELLYKHTVPNRAGGGVLQDVGSFTKKERVYLSL